MSELILKTSALVRSLPDSADAPFGSFEVILSTPKRDRDGEEVKSEEWELPLPERITFDVDHGMSVMTTVGSGTPSLDDQGRLVVRGTYASTELAQNTRALVSEGHITTVSVAFLRKTVVDANGSKATRRELLNGAFVAIPANTDAVVLSSKALEPTGNALVDALGVVLADSITVWFKGQAAHWNTMSPQFAMWHEFFGDLYQAAFDGIDPTAEAMRKLGAMAPASLSAALGAGAVADGESGTDPILMAADLKNAVDVLVAGVKAAFDAANSTNEQGVANFLAGHLDLLQKYAWQLGSAVGTKSVTGAEVKGLRQKTMLNSLQACIERVNDALEDAYENEYCYNRGVVLTDVGVGYVIYDAWSDGWETYQENFTDNGSVVTLAGDRKPVDVMEIVMPDADEDGQGSDSAAAVVTSAADQAAVVTSAAAVDDQDIRARALALQITALDALQ